MDRMPDDWTPADAQSLTTRKIVKFLHDRKLSLMSKNNNVNMPHESTQVLRGQIKEDEYLAGLFTKTA